MGEQFQKVDIEDLKVLAERRAQIEFQYPGGPEAIFIPDAPAEQERTKLELIADIEETLDVLDVLLDKKGTFRSIYVNSFEVTDRFASTFCSFQTEEHRDIRTSRVQLRDQQLFIWREDGAASNILLYMTESDKKTDELQHVVAHYGSFYKSPHGLMASYRADIRDGVQEELEWGEVFAGGYGPKVEDSDDRRVELVVPSEIDNTRSLNNLANDPYKLLKDTEPMTKLDQINDYLIHAQSLMDASSVSPE